MGLSFCLSPCHERSKNAPQAEFLNRLITLLYKPDAPDRKAKFIDFLPRDIGIDLNDKDVDRAREFLKYRWFQKKDWQDEIKRMPTSGLKVGLDALDNKDFQYLTKTYLPGKLQEKEWLD